MFVRFRQTKKRLQVSVLHSARDDERVRSEHLAMLGTIDLAQSERDRFWRRVRERLAGLGDRIDAENSGEVARRDPRARTLTTNFASNGSPGLCQAPRRCAFTPSSPIPSVGEMKELNVRTLARELRNASLPYKRIAIELERRGYCNRLGQRYSTDSIKEMLRGHGKARTAPTACT